MISKIVRPILKRAGLSNQRNQGQMNKWLLQSISGIKEVKVAKKEDYFLNQFSIYGKKVVESEKLNSVLGTVPKLAIEAIGVGSMLGVIALLLWSGRDVEKMLPQLTAFAMAAVRLLPSVNQISTSMNSVFYNEPALDKMIEHLSIAERWENETHKSIIPREKMGEVSFTMSQKVELSNITYSYPNSPTPVLKNANMVVPIGKSIGIVGTSGAGKTTAVDILLGLLPPHEGYVMSDGRNIQDDYSGWLGHISYIPQMIFMLDDTIRANVAFGITSEDIDEEQVWRALEEAQLKEFVSSLPNKLDTKIGERGVRLSGGQRQRLGIARALYTNPELLIFDEATSALDNETEAAIMESINALHGKKTLIIIAHRLTTINECDIVYRVLDGIIERER
jgi:ABC-type multidrug transport system fused ATPase/permease subunit